MIAARLAGLLLEAALPGGLIISGQQAVFGQRADGDWQGACLRRRQRSNDAMSGVSRFAPSPIIYF